MWSARYIGGKREARPLTERATSWVAGQKKKKNQRAHSLGRRKRNIKNGIALSKNNSPRDEKLRGDQGRKKKEKEELCSRKEDGVSWQGIASR